MFLEHSKNLPTSVYQRHLVSWWPLPYDQTFYCTHHQTIEKHFFMDQSKFREWKNKKHTLGIGKQKHNCARCASSIQLSVGFN